MWDLDAVICTCDIISRDSSFDKRWRQLSRQFLDELSEERVLLLGMLADASDELLQLVRFFDEEAFAIEKMAEKVQSFKQTVQVLFHHGACLRTGFTKLCLAHLRMQKAVRDGSGRVRMIGGPAFDLEALSKRCLQRMSAWSKVVHEVAATEFPEWELLGAFSAFRLAEPGTRAAGPAAARPPPSCPGRGVRDCLQQLASAFGITDPAGLCLEFQNHQRLAQGHKNMLPDTSDADAWRPSCFGEHPEEPQHLSYLVCEGIAACLGAFLRVPRLHSRHRARFELVQAHHGETVARLGGGGGAAPHPLDPCPPRAELVGEIARGRAAHLAGELRSSPAKVPPVLGHASARAPEAAANAAAGWRGGVARAAAACHSEGRVRVRPRHLGSHEGSSTQRSPQHLRRRARRGGGERRRRLVDGEARGRSAAPEGRAPGASLRCRRGRHSMPDIGAGRPGFRGGSNAGVPEEGHGRARELRLQQNRKQSVRAVPQPLAIPRGARVFVEDDARQQLDTPPGNWSRLRRTLGLQEEPRRHLASIIVVSNPAEPGDRNSFVSAVVGQTLCSPASLREKGGGGGGGGPWLQMRPAARRPRFIFVSAGVQAKHAPMIDLIKTAAASAAGGGRWRWFADNPTDMEQFQSRSARRSGSAHLSEIMTLVLPSEQAKFARWPRVQTLKEFHQSIQQIDHARSAALGRCGR